MIPKRTFWFVSGVASGLGGAIYGYARVREMRGRVAADQLAGTVADTVVGTARAVRDNVRDAVAEGRDAIDQAEERIRVQVEGRRAIDQASGRLGDRPGDPAIDRTG